jgi:PAS domain S-box-containing protein
VTFLNPVAEKLTGWKQTDAVGRPIGEIFVVIDEETRESVADPITMALHAGEITGVARHRVLLSHAGREFSIDDNAAPIRDVRQELAGAVLTFRDISHRRRNEQMAEEVRSRLEQSHSELEQFAYAASHDLREPLRNIGIYAQLLGEQYRGTLDANADRLIGFILSGTRRMEQMLKDLLAYTQASAVDGFAIHATDANLALGNVLASLKISMDESGAQITSDRLPEIPMDRVHLEQLLQNLIGNALKYRAQCRPEIHVGVKSDANDWVFCVADNGIGIPPAYQERIFGLFKRLHSVEEYEGTGIGLAICQKIVQRYGGRIWVESEPTLGSRFYFTVPTEVS